MLILPAIDLRGGHCVRLRQGDYARETVFSSDPEATARSWADQGASYLHLVDLDGAREGRLVNGQSIRRVVASVRIPCQLGGGLRSEDDVEEALSWGVQRVVIGTQALRSPATFEQICLKFPARVALGLDAMNGQVATDGWQQTSTMSALRLARQFERLPLAALIYTDISRDGMLEGPNFAALGEIAEAVRLPVIGSGGVTTLEDVRQLTRLPLAGCIIGRALYDGRLDLGEVIGVATST